MEWIAQLVVNTVSPRIRRLEVASPTGSEASLEELYGTYVDRCYIGPEPPEYHSQETTVWRVTDVSREADVREPSCNITYVSMLSMYGVQQWCTIKLSKFLTYYKPFTYNLDQLDDI